MDDVVSVYEWKHVFEDLDIRDVYRVQLPVSKVEESRSLDIHYMTVCYTCSCGVLLCTAVPLATAVVCRFLCAPLWDERVNEKKYKNKTEVSSPLV